MRVNLLEVQFSIAVRERAMSVAVKTTAISGVSPSQEVPLQTIYPSVAMLSLGQLLGQLYISMPVRILGIPLSALLFALPTAPLAALLYLWLKAFGSRYTITNRSVQQWHSLGSTKIKEVSLTDLGEAEIRQTAGQVFYRAADIVLRKADGKELLVIPGVPFPEVFRRTLLEVRDSRVKVAASLATIQARK